MLDWQVIAKNSWGRTYDISRKATSDNEHVDAV